MPQREAARPLFDDDARARNAAFAELHREHAVGVFNLALRLVGDRDDARDISQEVLLKAYQRLGKPGELQQRAWLYRVTVNACYDHLRRAKCRPRAAADPPELASTIDGYEQADLLRNVDWTLRQLPPTQRAALLLREVHGLRTDEVAYALGVQPDSAAVTLTRARTTFRRHFTAVSGIGAEQVSATTRARKRRKGITSALSGSGAAAFGFILPGLQLPQAPLPVGLEASSLMVAATAGVGMSIGSGGGGAALGVMAKIAAALSTKAAAIGAGATIVTGSIGGVYAVEKASQGPPPAHAPAATQPQTHKASPAGAGATTPSVASRPSGSQGAATPAPQPSGSAEPSGVPSPTTVPLPSESAAPSSTPVAEVPSASPTPITVGETSASPEPSPTASPSPTPDPTSTSPEPQPSPSPTASP